MVLNQEGENMESKEELLFSLNKSVENLIFEISKVIKNNMIDDEKSVYYAVGTSLHWIGTCLDRINQVDIMEEHKGIISAFKGAINAQKHNKDLIRFDSFMNCSILPFTLEAVLSDRGLFFWSKLNSNIFKWKNQEQNYKDYLEYNDVKSTILQIQDIIVDYFKEI